jgi:GNAT superfamily N-acetyltransferase
MTTETLADFAVDAVPDIPGIRFRRWRGLDDIPGMAAVADAANRAAGSADIRAVDSMLVQYRNLVNCDPELDIVVVELDGTIIAYGRAFWEDLTDGARSFKAIVFVEPVHEARGIQAALCDIFERRQVAQAAAMATELAGRRAFMARYAQSSEHEACARFEAAGFRLTRRWAEMVRPDFEAIPDLAVPDGVVLTRVDPADPSVVRRAFDVCTEVFADHFGEATATEADWTVFQRSPETQPALWCVALDRATGEVAGHILNYLAPPEPDGSIIGWTESIAVREPYRRRGLASAMLAESLRIVRDAGATRAALGVDQQNPHRALTLYERLGFRVTVESLEFHRDLVLPGAGLAEAER